jgi:CubicO group peptidase (beta-lactamase class C family)
VLIGAASLAAWTVLGGCGDDGDGGDGGAIGETTPDPGGATLYWPGVGADWEQADPDASGWSTEGLATVATLVGETNGRTFVMLTGGRILAEHYFRGADADHVQDVASCQKSVVSTLVGMARQDRLLDIEDAVSDHLGSGWSQAQPVDEARITIRHVLTMTSGLHPISLRKVDEPGARWDYNTAVYQKLRRVLETAAGRGIDDLSRQWILDPIGASTASHWIRRANAGVDPVGDEVWGLRMTARDMARFGLLSQRKGEWAGTRLLEATWYDEAWTPVDVRRDYGYLWWLMGQRPGDEPHPADWVAALGANDQKIYVIPSADLVVTRQGTAAAESGEHASSFDTDLVRALTQARA